MKKSILKEYAKLLATYGLNVQKGQDVIILSSVENPEFTALCVEECYKAGARKVVIDWEYQPLQKITYHYGDLETLSSLESYEEERLRYRVAKNPCMLYLESDDPDGLDGVNIEKMGAALRAKRKLVKKYRDQMDGKYQWCIAGVPGKAWSKKLFPELSSKAAYEKLWEKILLTSRALEHPVENWKAHDKDLKDRCEYLNSLGIESLHYTSAKGTDLTVGLMKESLFLGGGEAALESNIYFQPNIPSEECFTSPQAGKAEGIVYSTLPLSYNGVLIENFWIRFQDGKAVEWDAEKNKEMLSEIINMDEGSCRLGECALVPNSSPIMQSGVLFYNTLFDENATCHLALGCGFNSCVRGYEKLSNEECKALGVNDSTEHVDFMIGSSDLDIDAITRDGKVVPIFRQGDWAF